MSNLDVTVPSLLDHAAKVTAAVDAQRQAARELAAELAAQRPPLPSPAPAAVMPPAASTGPSSG